MILATWASCGFIVFVVLLAPLELELPPRNLLLGLGLEEISLVASLFLYQSGWNCVLSLKHYIHQTGLHCQEKSKSEKVCFVLIYEVLLCTQLLLLPMFLFFLPFVGKYGRISLNIMTEKKGGGEATPLKPGIGIRLRKRLWTKLFIMSILITRHTRSHSFFMSVYRTCSKWVSRQHSTKK